MGSSEEDETPLKSGYGTPWARIDDVHYESQASNTQIVDFQARYNDWYELVSGRLPRYVHISRTDLIQIHSSPSNIR